MKDPSRLLSTTYAKTAIENDALMATTGKEIEFMVQNPNFDQFDELDVVPSTQRVCQVRRARGQR